MKSIYRRGALVLCCLSLVATAAVTVVVRAHNGLTPADSGAGDQPSRASKLFKDSRLSIAIARAQGRHDVVVLVASVPGGAAAVAEHAESMGGNVRYREDELGYLRVRIPIDRVSEFAEFDRIEAIAMDYDDSYPGRLTTDGTLGAGPGDMQSGDPGMLTAGQTRKATASAAGSTAAKGAQEDEPWPPTWGDYPLRHAYSPLKDIDAAEMRAKHPTFDGRGVTIALLDGNMDLLHPEFQTAYTLDGKTVPKIADFLNVTDPRDDAELNAQWVNMQQQVVARDRQVTFGGKTFTTPHDGEFRIGFFNERRFNDPANGAYIDQDVDRNGNPKGDDGLFGVLWDESTNDVWVDTNRNLSFTDEKAMTDYIKRQDVGVFGKDDPATPIRESIGFAVQTDPKNKFVSINIGIYQHATIILGSVVGNREPHGRLQGIAPGARIVSMFWGVGVAHSMIEGLIAAFKHPLVDLIVLEQHVGVASVPYLLADAHHPISIIAQRLTERYHKLMFVPGSNAPGFGIVAEDGLAPGAVSVGGYQSQESYRLNAGFIPESVDNLHWGALSHGPSGIGALKPDFLAPSGQMGTDPVYRNGMVARGLFQLPPGYSIDGGTSTATPMACGSAALVVSAAKQTGVPYDAARLKAALTGSARYIPSLKANEQGSGLVQVEAAYELLKKLKDQPMVTITSRAPVHTRLSGLLPTPNEGVGIYERGGWRAGDHGTRTISFTRTSGPAEPMTFSLSWQGNDGTYGSGSSLTLPLNQPVDLPVEITVKDVGAHAAILTLDNPSIPGHAYRVLNTIVAPLEFTAENKYTVDYEVTVPRPGDRPVFVEVPPGAGALSFSATTAEGVIQASAITPGREDLYLMPAAGHPYTMASPEPGVWELNVCMNHEARDFDPTRENPLKPAKVKVHATLIGVDVAVDNPATASISPRSSVNLPVSLNNRFGGVTAGASNGALGSAFQTTRTIAQGEQQLYEVIVPEGATSLRARVSGVADSRADLDVYLLDCTSADKPPAQAPPEKEKGNKAPPLAPPVGQPKSKAATVDAGGEVEVLDPTPGRWVIVVDGYRVPAGRTTYSYLDVYTHPKLGTLAVTDTAERRDPGAQWKTAAHAWVASVPESSRALMAEIAVTSPDARTASGAPIVLGYIYVPLASPAQSRHTDTQRDPVQPPVQAIPRSTARAGGK
jgi:hypothetical protein